MGTNAPDLDDLEFEELFEEARRKIPVHSDEWTNHNAHDTGIAILELLAWLTETYSYQIDTVREADRAKHLSLLGVSRRPPTSATAELIMTVPESADGAVIPAGTPLVADDRSGVVKPFETIDDEPIVAANVERFLTNSRGDVVNNTTEINTENAPVHVFGEEPEPGDSMYLGLDADPFAESDLLEITFYVYDDPFPDPVPQPESDAGFVPSVELVWEYCTDYGEWETDAVWEPLTVDRDDTNSFYDGGVVRLEKPAGWPADAVEESAPIHGQPAGLVWLRCRIERAGYEIPPQLNTVQLNVLDVSHRRTVWDELLRRPDDTLETTIESDQEYVFEHAPVLEAEIVIDGRRWTEVDDLERSGPTDSHYVLDNQRGAITFGDGIDGATPPLGEHVVAERYVHGGGSGGNIARTAEWAFDRPEEPIGDGVEYGDIDLTPMGSAAGGTDEESVEDALDRFKRDLKETRRASTLADYERVAMRTPGLRFGRANARRVTGRTASGTEVSEVHVAVVPYSTVSKPRPSEGFLEAVREHLDRNRLVSDLIRVAGPRYVDIGASLVVSTVPGYDRDDLTAAVRSALRDHLHPITGFDGAGWPFGHPLYVAEVEDVVRAIPGVSTVEAVTLTANGEREIDDYGNVLLPEDALLALSPDDVTVSRTQRTETGGGPP